MWVIYSGSNDLIRGESAVDTAANISQFLGTAPSGVKIVLISLLRSPDRVSIFSEVDTFNSILVSLAKDRENVYYVDVNPGLADKNSHFLDDGIHLTDKGYQVLGNKLSIALRHILLGSSSER